MEMMSRQHPVDARFEMLVESRRKRDSRPNSLEEQEALEQSNEMAVPSQNLEMAVPSRTLEAAVPSQNLEMAVPSRTLEAAVPSPNSEMAVPSQSNVFVNDSSSALGGSQQSPEEVALFSQRRMTKKTTNGKTTNGTRPVSEKGKRGEHASYESNGRCDLIGEQDRGEQDDEKVPALVPNKVSNKEFSIESCTSALGTAAMAAGRDQEGPQCGNPGSGPEACTEAAGNVTPGIHCSPELDLSAVNGSRTKTCVNGRSDNASCSVIQWSRAKNKKFPLLNFEGKRTLYQKRGSAKSQLPLDRQDCSPKSNNLILDGCQTDSPALCRDPPRKQVSWSQDNLSSTGDPCEQFCHDPDSVYSDRVSESLQESDVKEDLVNEDKIDSDSVYFQYSLSPSNLDQNLINLGQDASRCEVKQSNRPLRGSRDVEWTPEFGEPILVPGTGDDHGTRVTSKALAPDHFVNSRTKCVIGKSPSSGSSANHECEPEKNRKSLYGEILACPKLTVVLDVLHG